MAALSALVAARYRASALWAGLLLCLPIYGTEYQAEQWTTEQGLPQNTILAIAQTPDGYMWLATWNGLVRFDGVRFTVFNRVNTPQLPSARIVDLQLGLRGELWIASEEDDLTRLTRGRFEVANGKWGLPTGGLYLQDTDPDGNLWVGSRKSGPHHRFAEGGFVPGVVRKKVSEQEMEGLKATQGCFWLPNDGHWERYGQPNFREDLELRGIHGVRVACPCKKGGIWLLGSSNLYHYPDWQVNKITGRDLLPDITDMVEDLRGNLWVTTVAGLFVIPPGKSAERVPLGPSGSTQFLRKLFIDFEGNIWIGSDVGGLFRVKSRVFRTITQLDGLSGDVIKSLTEDSKGTVWIAHEKGVDWIHPDRSIPNSSGAVVSALLSADSLWSLSLNQTSEAWFGVYNGTVWHWTEKRGKIPCEIADGTAPSVMRVLSADTHGGTWIGARNGLWHAAGDQLQSVPLPPNLPSSDVRVIIESPPGRLCLGIHGSGVLRRDGETWSRFGKTEGLADEAVLSLYQDADRILWIGTLAGGLSRIEDGHVVNLGPLAVSLPNLVSCIAEDDLGFLWLGSVNGIHRVSRQELNELARGQRSDAFVHHYGKGDGLGTTECAYGMQPTVCKGRDGQLWFATIHGVSVVDPEELASNSRHPPVAIEEIIVDDKPAPPAWLAPNLGGPNSHHQEITLPPGNHRLEIRYTALSFTAPEKIRFRHRLQNLDHGWNNVGLRRAAYMQGLRPGYYRFDVMACNNDGIWNPVPASLGVIMLPFFWQTMWFRIVGGTALVAAAAWLARFVALRNVRLNVARLERQNAVNQERARIARDMHDDLGANLTQIGLLSEMAGKAGSDPAQVSQDLRDLSGLAHEVVRHLDELVWVTNPDHDQTISFIDYLGSYAEESLRPRGIACRFDFPAGLLRLSVDSNTRHQFFLAFKEVLNNVLKHAAATEVIFHAHLENYVLHLRVSDNGSGFDSTAKSTFSNGLINLQHRLASLGGTCRFHSIPGQGTEVHFELPVGPAVTKS
jgi:ligand-binding sensor domain-containing protein/signal transduction histidine kinase